MFVVDETGDEFVRLRIDDNGRDQGKPPRGALPDQEGRSDHDSPAFPDRQMSGDAVRECSADSKSVVKQWMSRCEKSVGRLATLAMGTLTCFG